MKEHMEQINQILTVLHSNPSRTITLRRAFSKSINNIDLKTKFAYLEVTDGVEGFENLTKINWFTVSLLAKQLDMPNQMRMEEYLHYKYHDENITDSAKKRITKLLELNKTPEKLLKEMAWFVKDANSNGIRIDKNKNRIHIHIDEYSLYEDLLNWDRIAYSWARKIVRTDKEDKHD